jgi:glycosyltransferase involved in cell wall biosynthesis
MESMLNNMPEDKPIGSEEKPRIGFYLGNAVVPNADLRFPEMGNPGIGGSEFGLVALPYFLSSYFQDFDLVIYANVIEYLPNRLPCIQVGDSVDAAGKSIQDNCQILLVRLCDRDVTPNFIRTISGTDLKVIVWAQNNPTSQQMDIVAACANISRLVCVGHEELDLYRDHQAFYKTTCIFNGIYPPTYEPAHHIVGSGNTVVYMGSLVREKGFHILAKAWPQVKARVPGARLKVIGSGQVYDENATLGRWSVAEEDYEREFRPFLSNEKGDPDESVEFLGKLGSEKILILQQADIGVVNPNRNPRVGTETFCWSAVEFQACGTPVISAAEDGLLDTVSHRHTGLLTHNERSLAEHIVQLLEERELREKYGRNAMEYIRSRFDYGKICYQWQGLFFDVVHGQPNRIYPMKPNIFYHYKFLRETMRIAKYYIPPFRIIPSIIAIPDIGKRKLFSCIHKSKLLSRIYMCYYQYRYSQTGNLSQKQNS